MICDQVKFISGEDSLALTNVTEIPDDADLAETFYSQFEDEFENDDSENEVEPDEDDLSALMGQMQDALDQTSSADDTFAEAEFSNPSELTDSLRHQRIQALRTYPFENSSYCREDKKIKRFETRFILFICR